jgi:hypothetical protein
MYEIPASPEERPGCRDTLVITRAVLGVIIPPIAAMLAVLALVMLTIVMFATSPPLALIPLAPLVAAFVLFLRWEHGRGEPPPDL